eukprot:gene4736-5912_t
MNISELVSKLHEIDAVKLGEFKLKSGILSPIYIDLRVTVSSPKLLAGIAELMHQNVFANCQQRPSLVCGVPYTALPIATAMSIAHDIPMVVRRKEAKAYGTKQLIEGKFKEGDNVLVVEDLVTSGASVLETVRDLKSVGLVVTDVVVLLDRQQGARKELEKNGLRLHSVFTMEELINNLVQQGKMSGPVLELVQKFLEANRSVTVPVPPPVAPFIPFEERAKLATNPMSARLFNLMASKKTNLAVAADLTRKQEILNLADAIGPEICVLKTHVDIIEDYDQDFIQSLESIASKHNFLIFEDRKFADIGNTVKYQFQSGVYQISKWAHMVTIHGVAGAAIIDGFRESLKTMGSGLLLLAQMSSKGSMAVGEYTNQMIEIAKSNQDAVMGLICQERLPSVTDNFVLMTPGVQFESKGDQLGQQYNSPEYVIKEKGTDVIIVGRGIYQMEQNQQPQPQPILHANSNINTNSNNIEDKEDSTSPLSRIPTGKYGLNDTLYWGTYRPHLYFGMKTRSTKPINTGMIWSRPNIEMQRFLHKCEQGSDGVHSYRWTKHDGKHFGIQEIFDQKGRLNITTSFIKVPGAKGGDWTVRISGRSDAIQNPPLFSLMYYITDESISQGGGSKKNGNGGGLNIKGVLASSLNKKRGLKGNVQVGGNHPEIGNYTLYFSDVSESTHPNGPFLKGQPSTSKWHYYGISRFDERNWDIMSSIFDQKTQSHLSTYYEEWINLKKENPSSKAPFIPTLPNIMSENSNTVVIQRLLKVPFDVEISFVSHEFHEETPEEPLSNSKIEQIVKEMTGPFFNKILDSHEKAFDENFIRKIYKNDLNKVRFIKNATFDISKTSLSSLLGGYGYWYGSSLSKNKSTGLTFKLPPVALFSASPSRPAFPRGFLWDEGLHQLLVSSFDVDLTIETLSHWFNLMNENGWIPREQILGDEALSMVPSEFQIQLPTIANPPTLIMTINKLLDFVQDHKLNPNSVTTAEDVEKIESFLRDAYPRIVRYYNYYWNTQSSKVENLFRWRGRTPNHTLASGLDDYPRLDPPSTSELHVDLSSWVAFFAESLSKISLHLGKDDKKYLQDYKQIITNIDLLHWDSKTNLYHDSVYNSEEGKIEYFKTQGYMNYFPLFLGLVPKDSNKLKPLIDNLKDVVGIWSRYGIRSMSMRDERFGTGENYWKGPIWFNINYLFVHTLDKKYVKSGPLKDDIYDLVQTLKFNLVWNIVDQYQKTGYLWEQYNPSTGEGQRNHPFNGWTSLFTLLASDNF